MSARTPPVVLSANDIRALARRVLRRGGLERRPESGPWVAQLAATLLGENGLVVSPYQIGGYLERASDTATGWRIGISRAHMMRPIEGFDLQFVIGHELGHWAFRVVLGLPPRALGFPKEETYANYFGVALLGRWAKDSTPEQLLDSAMLAELAAGPAKHRPPTPALKAVA